MREVPRFRRRDLPHWDIPGSTYFITACLAGSIPAHGLRDIRQFEDRQRGKKCPPGISIAEWEVRRWKAVFARVDSWLDDRPAVCHLADPALATLVVETLLYFIEDRYDVLALVVMPSHFHWAFRPREAWVRSLEGDKTPRQRIMQSVKGSSARRCNQHRGARGPFWQEESYDHWIRDADELERIIRYIELNPVRAGLVEHPELWAFSSAQIRQNRGIPFGSPLKLGPGPDDGSGRGTIRGGRE
jgi:type I restriction enzyme R subunit